MNNVDAIQQLQQKWMNDATLFNKMIAGNLSESEWKELDMLCAEDPFFKDTAEGLLQINNPEALSLHLYQLQKHLKQTISKQTSKRKKLYTFNFTWLISAIILLLLVSFAVCFILFKNH